MQASAENRRFSQIHPFLLEIQGWPNAGFCSKAKIFAENRSKPQIGVRHLRSITLSSALAERDGAGIICLRIGAVLCTLDAWQNLCATVLLWSCRLPPSVGLLQGASGKTR